MSDKLTQAERAVAELAHPCAKPEATKEYYTDKMRNRHRNVMPLWNAAIHQQERIQIAEEALRSIAANTCCEPCQEAKLVAEQALARMAEEGNRG